MTDSKKRNVIDQLKSVITIFQNFAPCKAAFSMKVRGAMFWVGGDEQRSWLEKYSRAFLCSRHIFPSSSQTDRLKQANLKKQKITFGQCDRETQKIKP